MRGLRAPAISNVTFDAVEVFLIEHRRRGGARNQYVRSLFEIPANFIMFEHLIDIVHQVTSTAIRIHQHPSELVRRGMPPVDMQFRNYPPGARRTFVTRITQGRSCAGRKNLEA